MADAAMLERLESSERSEWWLDVEPLAPHLVGVLQVTDEVAELAAQPFLHGRELWQVERAIGRVREAVRAARERWDAEHPPVEEPLPYDDEFCTDEWEWLEWEFEGGEQRAT